MGNKHKKREKYLIRIGDTLVDVTEEQYLCYYRSMRRMRYFEHDVKTETPIRDEDKNIIGYEPSKEEPLERILCKGMDFTDAQECVEDVAIRNIMLDKLYKALDMLSEDERELISALFFSNSGNGMSERKYAEISGIPYQTVHSRKTKIYKKLKKMLEK